MTAPQKRRSHGNPSRLRQGLEALHEIGAIGVGGGLAACLVIGVLRSGRWLGPAD